MLGFFLAYVLGRMLFRLPLKCNHSSAGRIQQYQYYKTESSRAIIRKDEILLVKKHYLKFTDYYL